MSVFSTIALFATAILAAATASAQEAPEGFASLFDGKSLDGWEQKNGSATYEVVDGAVLGTTVENSPNSFLCSKKEYGDFELQFEVKCDPMLNSGVQIRSVSKPEFKKGRVHGPQIEIDGPSTVSGFVYSEGTGRGWISQTRKKHTHYKNEDWNTYRIVAQGRRVQTWINGESIEDVEVPEVESKKGFLGLQVHGLHGEKKKMGPYKVQWKNIFIKELAADRATDTTDKSNAKKGLRKGKALHGTPVVDGKIDDIWKNVPALMANRDVEIENTLEEGQKLATASVKCLWDDGHLYCLAEVKDDKIGIESLDEWAQDSVEFFVDANMSKTGPYDGDDAQYRTNATGANSFGPSTIGDNYTSKATKVDGGYIIEACIKLKTEPGKKIGFDVQVNNDPGSGIRGSIAKWNDATNNTWENMAGVGVLELSK